MIAIYFTGACAKYQVSQRHRFVRPRATRGATTLGDAEILRDLLERFGSYEQPEQHAHGTYSDRIYTQSTCSSNAPRTLRSDVDKLTPDTTIK